MTLLLWDEQVLSGSRSEASPRDAGAARRAADETAPPGGGVALAQAQGVCL